MKQALTRNRNSFYGRLLFGAAGVGFIASGVGLLIRGLRFVRFSGHGMLFAPYVIFMGVLFLLFAWKFGYRFFLWPLKEKKVPRSTERTREA